MKLSPSYAIFHPDCEKMEDCKDVFTAIPVPIGWRVLAEEAAPKHWTFVGKINLELWGKCNWIEHKGTGGILDVVDPMTIPEIKMELEVKGKEDWQRDRIVWSSHFGVISRILTHSFCERVDGKMDYYELVKLFCEIRILAEGDCKSHAFQCSRYNFKDGFAIDHAGPIRDLFVEKVEKFENGFQNLDPFSYRKSDPIEIKNKMDGMIDLIKYWKKYER